MQQNKRSLKDLLLLHELAFILLIFLVAAIGAFGIQLQEKSSQESNRINLLVQEVQQTRGDLYRQMKELFDVYFLDDSSARSEYDHFTLSVENHFTRLEKMSTDEAERLAIKQLHRSYQAFLRETSALFDEHTKTNTQLSKENLKKELNTGLETGLFAQYEGLLTHTEQLLNQKQIELDKKLKDNKRLSSYLLLTPLILAILLLLFSRVFLKRAIVKPLAGLFNASQEISAGNLLHRVPDADTKELSDLSKAINHMAEKLVTSQEALVRTEKQAAQGLLVPMLAHNIRNPLASIRATAQVMESPEHDADTRDSLTGIISTVDRLERWTGALLAYLHPLKPQPEDTRLQDIVVGALEPLQHKIDAKAIKMQLPLWRRYDDRIYTDQHLLEQVLYNLLLNAIDASGKAATITIELVVETKDEEKKFILSIVDQGSGMPFTPDPSAMSAPSTKRFGTGIGIPFAFKTCDALGGQLAFINVGTGGTIVRLTFPSRCI